MVTGRSVAGGTEARRCTRVARIVLRGCWLSILVEVIRVRRSVLPFVILLLAISAHSSVLPGFSIKTLGTTAGFVTSLAADSQGTLYYTTQDGRIFRFEPPAGVEGPWQSTLVARVITVALSDSGLLGMSLRDDQTAVVHYTRPNLSVNRFGDVLADVVSWIDLRSGKETILHSFDANVAVPEQGEPAEHHGGNPTVAPDGSVFVGIGDYNVGLLVLLPGWHAGRVFQIFPDGSAREFARGFRNPFDIAWDDAHQRLIVPDNGVGRDDEINIIHSGDDAGWPNTAGNAPPCEGCTPPVYVFPTVVAPTGLVALKGRNPILQSGYLLTGFVTKTIYYIPDIDARPLPAPIPIVKGEPGVMIDIAEGGNGELVFATPKTIYRLNEPARGDCNGDGLVNLQDLSALAAQLAAGTQTLASVLTTTPPGSFGCDADGDGSITSADTAALMATLHLRLRSVRRR